jgi:hypothetical protein
MVLGSIPSGKKEQLQAYLEIAVFSDGTYTVFKILFKNILTLPGN